MTFHTRKYIFLLYINFFHTRKFLIRRTVLLRTFLFRPSDTETFENRHASYYAWNFSVPDVFWNTEGFPTNFFRQSETKTFRQKRDASSHEWYFWYQKISETQKGWSTNFFVPLREKLFDAKSWYSPIMQVFFDTPFFDTLKGSPQSVSVIWDKVFSPENLNTLPLIHNLFSIPENIWYTEGFPYKFFRFGRLRRKIFDKTVVPPPLPMNENFWYQTFFEAQKGFLTKFFGNLRQKIFVKTVMLPPMTRRNLSIPEVFWNTEGFHHNFFGNLRQKIFVKLVMPPLPINEVFW